MKNQREYYLTREVVEGLHKSIMDREFIKISKMELIENVKDSMAKNFLKSKSEGIETCYHRFINQIELIVCTTDSDYLGDLKKHDVGWALLISPDSDEPFFSFEIKRTKNYCTTMIDWVDCMIEIAMKWPKLPGTNIPLRLVRVKNKMHMRRFRPPKGSGNYPRRKPYYFWIIEMDLTEKNSIFLIRKFKRFYDYRRKDDTKRIESGESPRQFERVIRYERKHGKPSEIGVRSDVNEYTDIEPNYDVPD